MIDQTLFDRLADKLVQQGELVSYSSVQAALQEHNKQPNGDAGKGASYRDLHTLLTDWRDRRRYKGHLAALRIPEKMEKALAVGSRRLACRVLAPRRSRAWGCRRTAELLRGQAPRIHWYSLYDLPREWEATTRHREAEGSSYYRHFHMGLLRQDGTPKLALEEFALCTPDFGLCQWFHYQDHRLDEAVAWMKHLGVKHLRTGLSWADSFRPDALAWFDRQMAALEDFSVTVTFCFTPEHRGISPHHTSAPLVREEFAEFCAAMVRRYAGSRTARVAAPLVPEAALP